MNVLEFASMFSGGEGAGVGARQAGLKPIWGIEYDAGLSSVAERNGFHSIIADVREVNYASLRSPYWLHMSPVCKNASTANALAGESPLDIETAQACVRAITALRPPFISLENVRGYESFAAFHLIVRCLMDEGYNVAWWILNSADYGVPQTRERLILVASRVSAVRKPVPTHAKAVKDVGQMSMFESPLKPWVGWYEAVEDLIPSLPETTLAPWQLKRLPADLARFVQDGGSLDGWIMACNENASSNGHQKRSESDPAFTVTASGFHKAMLVTGGNTTDGRDGHTRFMSVTPNLSPKALLFQANESTWENSNRSRIDTEPVYTIKASIGGKTAMPKALLFDGRNYRSEGNMTVLSDDKPAFTVIASNTPKRYKAILPYRVVKMSTRCLARFQSFPDTYWLPDKNKLASTAIGNAVPPLLMQAVIEANLKGII